MRKILIVLIGLGVVSSFPPVSLAVGSGDQGTETGDLLEDATSKVIQALEFIIGSISQYRLPVVLDNGDNIIRRAQPETKLHPEQLPNENDVNETST